ncbi:hypothetical protein MASR1M45_30140 [Candidatus Kapaibacterium sp.]
MRIDTSNLQRAYNYSTGNVNKVITKDNIAKKTKISDDNVFERKYKSNDLITSGERKFFVNMFPESTKQIMTHEVFTRSGRIKEVALSKGTIIDGRI